jgi:hypothetical protein
MCSEIKNAPSRAHFWLRTLIDKEVPITLEAVGTMLRSRQQLTPPTEILIPPSSLCALDPSLAQAFTV